MSRPNFKMIFSKQLFYSILNINKKLTYYCFLFFTNNTKSYYNTKTKLICNCNFEKIQASFKYFRECTVVMNA